MLYEAECITKKCTDTYSEEESIDTEDDSVFRRERGENKKCVSKAYYRTSRFFVVHIVNSFYRTALQKQEFSFLCQDYPSGKRV